MRTCRLVPLLGLMGCLGPPSIGTWGFYSDTPGLYSIGCPESHWEPEEFGQALKALPIGDDPSPDFTICPTQGAWLLGEAIDYAFDGVWPEGLAIAGRDDDPDDGLGVQLKLPTLTIADRASLTGEDTVIRVVGATTAQCEDQGCELYVGNVTYSEGALHTSDPALRLDLHAVVLDGDATWTAKHVTAENIDGDGDIAIQASGAVSLAFIDTEDRLSIDTKGPVSVREWPHARSVVVTGPAESVDIFRVDVQTDGDDIGMSLDAMTAALELVDIVADFDGFVGTGPVQVDLGKVKIQGPLRGTGARLDVFPGSLITNLRVLGAGLGKTEACLTLQGAGEVEVDDVDLSRCDVAIRSLRQGKLITDAMEITSATDCVVATDSVDVKAAYLSCNVAVKIDPDKANCSTQTCVAKLRGVSPSETDVSLADGTAMTCNNDGFVEWQGQGELVSATGCTP